MNEDEVSEPEDDEMTKTNITQDGDSYKDHRVRFILPEKDAIDTIAKRHGRFTKRDQIKANMVRRLQHVAAFPSDIALKYSVTTNSIKNNPLTIRDIKIYDKMLRRSKYMH